MQLSKILVGILLGLSWQLSGQEVVDSLTLPVYSIEIEDANLEHLYRYPFSDDYYPAVFHYDTITLPCEVRFRGASSRNLPKKSWKIKFPSSDNVFGVEKLNLNAEYRDPTLMRNFLSMKLFDHFHIPASRVEYVNVKVNGELMGLFVSIEQVDENFLMRNGFTPGPLYKGVEHGANMSPLLDDHYFEFNWEPKIANEESDHQLKELFSKLYFMNSYEFYNQIEQLVDIEYFINYMAIIYCTASLDNFTKNIYLYRNPETGLYNAFPWDNDAAYGNIWTGEYMPWLAETTTFEMQNNQILFRRLTEYDEWKEMFNQRVQEIGTEGLEYLNRLKDSIFVTIEHDYLLDPMKRVDSLDIHQAMNNLTTFLERRQSVMDSYSLPSEVSLSDPYINNSFAFPSTGKVSVHVRSHEAQKVYFNYVVGLDPEIVGDYYKINELELFDDGQHDDGELNDLIYGNSLNLDDLPKELIPCYFSNEHGLQYMWNGLIGVNNPATRTIGLSINNRNNGDFYKDIEIGRIFHEGNNFFVELINHSNQRLDLSGGFMRCDLPFQIFPFPENTILDANDALIIEDSDELASYLFPDFAHTGPFNFSINEGSLVQILSPSFEMVSEMFAHLTELVLEPNPIVINEIFYHPADGTDQSDWVELLNSGEEAIDLSGWTFTDHDLNHNFTIPDGTILGSRKYLILCREKEKFSKEYPDIEQRMGDFQFNLNADGELLRLFNKEGVLVDSVRYDNQEPWPEEPDVIGNSIELINPYVDNGLAENWKASLTMGTPGHVNSQYQGDGLYTHNPVQLFNTYPNPFTDQVTISFNLAYVARVELSIIDPSGRLIHTFCSSQLPSATHHFKWNPGFLNSGVYFVKLQVNNRKTLLSRIVHITDR